MAIKKAHFLTGVTGVDKLSGRNESLGKRICSPSCSDERWAGWLNIADEALRERVATLC
jgi:hypothetical protein